MQAEPGQQGLLHQLGKRLLQTARRQIAEQADTGVGVLAMAAWLIGRRPLAIVSLHLLERLHLVGELQRQTPGTVSGKLGHGDAIKGGALEPGSVPAHLVIQPNAPLDHGVGPQGRSQSLADRANLEQGLLADLLPRRQLGNPVVEVVGLPLFEHGYRHARDPVLFHQWTNDLIHYPDQRIGGSGLGEGRQQQGAQRQQRQG